MPAATGGKLGRADSGCEMSDGREAVRKIGQSGQRV